MQKLTAIIIKGNPKFIASNLEAEKFYQEIAEFLKGLGYEVSFDPGEPHTSPLIASLWIGHSRGGDRLSPPVPDGVATLLFGSSRPGAINHPEDNTKHLFGPTDVVPNVFHYTFTDEMRQVIDEVTRKIRSL